MQSTINLLRPAEKESAQVITIKEEARKITLIAFIVCISAGIIILSASIILNLSLKSAEETNISLKKQIQEYKKVESMLSVVKTRTTVVEKALEYSKPVDIQVGFLREIAPPPILQTIVFDENEKMTVTYKPVSIEQTMEMAAALVNLAEKGNILNPRIDSYSLDKDGIRIVFSYMVNWSPQ